MQWRYRGEPVRVPAEADIPAGFRRGQEHGDLVQRVLDVLPPWETSSRMAFSLRLTGVQLRPHTLWLPPEVEPMWGVHVGHKAQAAGLSPFYRPEGTWPQTDILTVVMSGKPDQPRFVSVYPGAARPPLPWMHAARRVPAGESEAFWNFHAFLLTYDDLIRPGTITSRPPEWYVRSGLATEYSYVPSWPDWE